MYLVGTNPGPSEAASIPVTARAQTWITFQIRANDNNEESVDVVYFYNDASLLGTLTCNSETYWSVTAEGGTESGEEDANPIRCVYEFMTNTRWGIGLSTDDFDGDPDTVGSPWKTASDYCDELVQFTDWNDILVDEPRFRYSNSFDARSKGYDILTNILNTCRGMVRLKQGKFEPLIENPDEEVTRYYSDRHKENFTVGGSSTINRLYADFSAYSDIYWYGDEGVITISDIDYYFIVKDQTSTYIDLFEDLPVSPNSGDSFHIVKDNISEGSFSYKAFSKQEKSNVFRVEFINRKVKDKDDVFKNLYQWEAYDYDSPITYEDPDIFGAVNDSVKIKTMRMKGIKRKSQAMRVAQNFGDFADAVNHFCELTTGHGGYIHGVGDIIGISHAQTGWDGKEFRIVAMDETENDEISPEDTETPDNDDPAQEVSEEDSIGPEDNTSIIENIDYSDSANFRIEIDLSRQRLTVFYREDILKEMICSGGALETPTPLGEFTTNQKIEYSWVDRFDVGAYYWIRFFEDYLIHSVPFDENGEMIVEEFEKLGNPASHGCVRLRLDEAKWLYETLPLGVKVLIY